MNDRTEVNFLCCDEGKARTEIEAHLVAEDALRTGAGAIGLRGSLVQDELHEIVILLHPIIKDRRVRTVNGRILDAAHFAFAMTLRSLYCLPHGN